MNAVATRMALPASGLVVDVRHPTGTDELLLLEQTDDATAAALALAQGIAHAADGSRLVWETVPIYDVDFLVVRTRQVALGDRIIADIVCGVDECQARIDISFSIDAYLTHHRPIRQPRGRDWSVQPLSTERGWFAVTPTERGRAVWPALEFRLPSIGDVLEIHASKVAPGTLAIRCTRPPNAAPALRRRVAAAMQALAPALAGALHGACPECGAAIDAYFDARRYCLAELRGSARSIYDDVDLVAQRYHWTEAAILSLPVARRAMYVESARHAGAA